MRAFRLLLVLVVSSLAFATAAQAQTSFLELDPTRGEGEIGEILPDLRVCDILHEIYPVRCRYWHVIAVIEVARAEQGQVFRAESARGEATFRVQWGGVNFLLENGVNVAPVGGQQSNDVIGARWIETYPGQGRSRVVTGWTDRNDDGKVGVLDTLVLDNGREVRITDQRFGLFVSPTQEK